MHKLEVERKTSILPHQKSQNIANFRLYFKPSSGMTTYRLKDLQKYDASVVVETI